MRSHLWAIVAIIALLNHPQVAGAMQSNNFGEISIPTAASGTSTVTIGYSQGCVIWLTETASDRVGCVTNGKITEFRLSPGAAPVGIATNDDKTVTVIESGLPAIAVVQPGGEIKQLDSSPGLPGAPFSITRGPNCAAWYTVEQESSLAWYSVSRGGRTVGPTAGHYRPWKLAAVEGVPYLWFIDKSGQHVWKMDYKSAVHEVDLTSGSPPADQRSSTSQELFGSSIAVAQDETVWFSKAYAASVGGPAIGRLSAAGEIKYFKVPTNHTQIGGIAWDGSQLWFTEFEANKIGRIDRSGVVVEFPIPTAEAGPTGITVDASGTVWFAETRANRIGWMHFPATPLRNKGY